MLVKSKITELLNNRFENTSYFLVDVKQSGNKYMVFIDDDDGLTVDDCANINRFLSNQLEAEHIVPDNYILEVSSPGLTNPLKHVRQYKKSVGETLSLFTHQNQHLRGILTQVDEEKLTLEMLPSKRKKTPKSQNVKINFGDIRKANVIIRFK